MFDLLLTQSNTFIIGDIAKLLGYIMEWIFEFTNLFGIQNFGLSIVLFTVIINLLMLPLTIKQQKFTRISGVMNPEIQAINKKYKDKKDNESLMRMREEMNDVYARYGVSQSSGCLQLIIQMPIFFALWKVISNIPAYVDSVKEVYLKVIDNISAAYPNFIEMISEAGLGTLKTSTDAAAQTNYVVDLFYQFNNEKWNTLANLFDKVPNIVGDGSYSETIMKMNRFIGDIYLTETPSQRWKSIAILIPIIAGLLQWLSVRLSTQKQTSSQNDDNPMAANMKVMNNFMPLFSVFVCFGMNCGLGLYWIASSGVRVIIQLIINFVYGRIELQDLIARNVEKNNKKRAKKGLPPQKVANLASLNTRNLSIEEDKESKRLQQEKKESQIKKSTEYYNSGEAKPGSLAAKAQMVQKYNEKNLKK